MSQVGPGIAPRTLHGLRPNPSQDRLQVNAKVSRVRALRLSVPGAVVVLLAGAFGMLIALCTPLLAGRVPTFVDLGVFHIPLRQFYADCLARGQPFDWMPGLFCGFFLTGEGQLGSYHPLHILLYRWLRVDTAFGLEMVLHVPWMFAGLYLFLRRHVDLLPATFGAISFTFSLQFTRHLQHPNIAAVLAHLPWLLLVTERMLQARSRRLAMLCGIFSMLVGSQILLGHPQAFWLSTVTVAAYAAFRAATTAAWRIPVILGATGILGLCVGAMQLFPTYDFLRHTTRSQIDTEFAMLGSVQPTSLLSTVAPNTAEGVPYRPVVAWFGSATLLLAVWLAAGRLPSPRADMCAGRPGSERLFDASTPLTSLVVFGAVFASVMTWLALGRHGGLYHLHTWLPIVGRFRAVDRFLTLAQFGLVLVAVAAVHCLLNQMRRGEVTPWKRLWPMWLLVGVSFALTAAARWNGVKASTWQSNGYWGPILFAAAAAGITLAARQWAWGLVVLAAVVVCDVTLFGITIPGGHKETWRRAVPLATWAHRTRPQRDPGDGRIHDCSLSQNCVTLSGARLANGYAGLCPVKSLDYNQLRPLQLAGVTWYRTWPKMRKRELGPWDNWGWQRIASPLPRVRVVKSAVVSQSPADDLDTIDPATTALVEHPIELDAGTAARVGLVNEIPGRLEIEVHSPGRQLLVVSESFSPGWEAAIDGRPAELLRVYDDFMGCVVGPETRRVQFSFRPASLRFGRTVSIAGLVVALGLCLTPLFPGRRRRDNPAAPTQS